MKTIILCITLIFSISSFAQGELLLIGGGKRTPAILKKMIELSGDGPILLVPLASEIPEEIVVAVKSEFEALGFKNAEGFQCKAENVDDQTCLRQIENAHLVFFTGGDQNRLLKSLANTEALKLIRKKNKESLHLAGTSAGTAIMSEIMLTGEALAPYIEFDGIRPKMVETTQGFGFVKKMIIDQHFLKRSRENRLMSAVFDHPELIGVGIDEATALLIHANESFEVLGDSAVMVIDARKSTISVSADRYQARDLKVELLMSGSSFKF
ncbi:MAG: cyanophycinase [Bacteriovoracaceae bacterium]